MYIKKIHIENFRNFRNIDVVLKKYTTIIGENDIGKSNLIDAIKLLLNNNTIQFYSKSLSITDINEESIKNFKRNFIKEINKIENDINEGNDLSYIIDLIPKVVISITFVEAKDNYQKKLLYDWLNCEENNFLEFEIEYCFMPKDPVEMLKLMLILMKTDENAEMPVELYEYSIYSTNNSKQINLAKIKNFNISIIKAERDNFSENTNRSSYKFISSLLENNLTPDDKGKINKAYNDFFDSIKNLSSFKDIFKKEENTEFDNFKVIIENMDLIPNLPNLTNIFSNISIGYNEEFLYQKGLGTRNLLLMLILFSNYNSKERKFNMICVEEPEAHLCVDNLNVALDYIQKSIKVENDYCQTLITTHNPKVINKLRLDNVVVLKKDKSITFEKEEELTNYLIKRPNFDILKILLSNRVILVEGPTEEMFINTVLFLKKNILNSIEVISIGQKGFKKFLDIWKKLNIGTNKKIGIVRDYDNQDEAKKEHDLYNDDANIYVRTTTGYTFENDLVSKDDNETKLKDFFGTDDPLKYMKDNKADSMLKLCNAMLSDEEDKIVISVPSHIEDIINGLQ